MKWSLVTQSEKNCNKFNRLFSLLKIKSIYSYEMKDVETILTELKKIKVDVDNLLKKIDSDFEIKKLGHFDPLILQMKNDNLHLMGTVESFIKLFEKCKESDDEEELISLLRNISIVF